MHALLKRRGVRQFIKFGLVGASSTAIDWSIFYLFSYVIGIYYLTAKVLSFAIAVVNSFIWNRRWTFRSKESKKLKEFTKFIIIALIGLSINALIMYFAVSILGWRKIFGLASATALTTFWNFLANKFYTFKNQQG